MWLLKEAFKSIIQHTLLIFIDLIVRNEQWKALLVRYINVLDKGYWFVLIGYVRKNITLDHAFVLLVREQLDIECCINRSDVRFLGLFEYFYDKNSFEDSRNMYYVILSYILRLKESQMHNSARLQREEYKFFNLKELLLNYKFYIYIQNHIKLLS